MTTNSFGSALPRFDFPQQPVAPTRLTARAARFFPSAAIVTTVAAACYYSYVYVPNQQPSPATLQHNQPLQGARQWSEPASNARLRFEGKLRPSS
ncbi:hypothetical protein F66182_3792 [Fusarium sp. NRRL 66182]|nr:hypothetical protein F66182_3792 [Fusarium sp. NRRL 66182]